MNVMDPSDPGTANVYTLMCYDVPLCVECPSCRRRAIFEVGELQHFSVVAEMASLAGLSRRMRCTCGHLGAKWKRPPNREAAVQWLEGWDVLW